MKIRKPWSLPESDIYTHVYDPISATIPDQSLSLRDMMLQFAYIGTERLEDIVNRGYDGDEDDDEILGVDVGALDFAEVHDRMTELESSRQYRLAVHAPAPAPSESAVENKSAIEEESE